MFKKNKGFIGAIGDDLPSLIPIFLGLVVFFAVFLGVFNDYNDKNKIYALNQEAIEISMQLKSDPVITSYSHFQERCNNIDSTKKWVAFLVDLPLDAEYYKTISMQDLYSNYENFSHKYYFICADEKYNLEYDLEEDILDDLKDYSRNIINYLYPISLQRDQGHTSLARLYILIWE